MEKKTYIRPTLKALNVKLENMVAASPDISGESGEIDESGGIQSKVWKFMQADDNAAASQQADDEEEGF